MSTIPTYTILPIEPPVSPSQLAAYKTLRLASLQIDSHAFASTYAREVTFSNDDWRRRLDSSSKRTFVASSVSENLKHGTDVDAGADNVKDLAETGEWVGMASIIGHSEFTTMACYLDLLRKAGLGANWEIYGLFAMWVHPAHRGRGVGVRLVKACLEWAQTHVDVELLRGHENREKVGRVVVLLVYDHSVAGRALYFRTGFTDLEGVTSEEGERWMLARV